MVQVWKDKEIYTLVSAPDSKLEDTGEDCFTYDSFVLVTTASEFNKWRMVHYAQDNGMTEKSWKVTQLKPKPIDRPQVKKRISDTSAPQPFCAC